MGKKQDADQAAKRVEVEERIHEAWDVLRRMPDRERALLRNAERGSAWPLIVHSADEHAAWAKEPARRPPPSAAQITRLDEVLDWLLVLAKQERKFFNAVWLFCALNKGAIDAAKVLGCHRETATVWRDAGLDRIVQHLAVSSMSSKRLTEGLMQVMHHPKRACG